MTNLNASALVLKHGIPAMLAIGASTGLTATITLSGSNNSPQVANVQFSAESIAMTLSDPVLGESYIRAVIPVSADAGADLLARDLGDLSISITDNYTSFTVETNTITLPLANYTIHKGASSATYVLEGRGNITAIGSVFTLPANIVSKTEFNQAGVRKLTVGLPPDALVAILPGDTTVYSGVDWSLATIQFSMSITNQQLTFYLEEIL